MFGKKINPIFRRKSENKKKLKIKSFGNSSIEYVYNTIVSLTILKSINLKDIRRDTFYI